MDPEWYGRNFKGLISEHMSQIMFMGISFKIATSWMPGITFDYNSTFV